jgi:carbonic anhydrase
VHRNVANLVVNTDLNMLSVLQYAVEVLKVKDIIVCGHYGCGGVKAALHNQSFGMLNKWLRNIKDVYRIHRDEINAISNEDKRVDALVELNVKEQVLNLAKTSIIQRAWLNHQRPAIHGWVYDIKDGILRDLIRVDHTYQLDPIYRYDENELR